MSLKLAITRLTDIIFLAYELIIGNRRLIFPTMIGLIIALTVISQSGLLIESYRDQIFDEVIFQDRDEHSGDIIVDLNSWSQDYSSLDIDFYFDFELYEAIVNKSINESNYDNYIATYFWYSMPEIVVWVNQTGSYNGASKGMNTWSMRCFSSSVEEFYQQALMILENEGAGRLPQNSSEFVLIRPKGIIESWEMQEEFENITLNSKINISLPIHWGSETEIQYNKTIKIVGVLEYEYTSSYYYYDYYRQQSKESDNTTTLLQKYLDPYLWGHYLLSKPLLMKETLGELSEKSSDTELRGTVNGKIFLETKQFNAYDVNTEISKLSFFLMKLEENFYTSNLYPSFHEGILWAIQHYESTLLALIILQLLVSFPVICIALYLVVYSFGLIRRQKQEQIGIIKTRGGSWVQILVVLLAEMIVSTFIAVILGFILSIGLADIVMRSTEYLGFLGTPVPVEFSLGMFQNLIFWGLFFALTLNFSKIIRMSRQNITETLIPTETQSPVWKRYYLDVIMFVIGTSTWIILVTLLRASSEGTNLPYNVSFYLLYMIISLLGLPAPFLIFFGSIMIIARIFPYLMKQLAELLWKFQSGVSAFAIRNIIRHKQAANRAVLLITLALSFSILASSLTFSLDETERLKYYYKEGADITISISGALNNSIMTLLKHNVSQLSSVSGVYLASYGSSGISWASYHFMFVDPSLYADTAFIAPYFKLSSSLPNLMNQLADNNTIILFEGNIKAKDTAIGKNFSLSLTNDSGTETYSFNIGGSFKYWPMMYPESWYDHTHYYWMIGSFGMFEQLNSSGYFTAIQGKYIAKTTTQDKIEETLETIYNITNIVPSSPVQAYKEYKTSFTRHFSLSVLNSDLIICITVVIIGVIMFAFFTYVERGKEIGVERALGMKRLQTAQSFLVEASTILAFGIIIGSLTGVYFVTMFLQITQFGQQIPPSVVTYPIPLLIQMLFGILVIAGVGTIAPAYLATRKDISRILKVE